MYQVKDEAGKVVAQFPDLQKATRFAIRAGGRLTVVDAQTGRVMLFRPPRQSEPVKAG